MGARESEYGISREQFVRKAQTNLALHHPAFQRKAADAVHLIRQRLQMHWEIGEQFLLLSALARRVSLPEDTWGSIPQ